ncbi:unnamed protein product, partial [Trichogramma brassicae]
MSTETMTYKLGDLVWAKMKGYSPWPGRVSNPIKDMKKPATTKKIPIYCIYFFGTNNYGWIDEANIKPYQEHKDQCKQMCKTANFKEACDTIENFISGGEETPPLDVATVSQALKDKNIQASDLKFGFLGLGIMGSGIVKNLLNSGHKVVIWNRSQEKCNDFVEAGAEKGLTPADVVAMSDITFSCVADPQAAKEMVFGNCGVLSEITADKGYVEMTSIDAETSADICEAIMAKGARYLEAQVQGSKPQAEEGNLVILGAGDRQLFDDCNSCFQAMGKNAIYLGEVGNASKMNLVLQTMTGICLVGLAESMALADRAGLQQKDVLEIMEMTSLASPLLTEKGKEPIHVTRNFKKDYLETYLSCKNSRLQGTSSSSRPRHMLRLLYGRSSESLSSSRSSCAHAASRQQLSSNVQWPTQRVKQKDKWVPRILVLATMCNYYRVECVSAGSTDKNFQILPFLQEFTRSKIDRQLSGAQSRECSKKGHMLDSSRKYPRLSCWRLSTFATTTTMCCCCSTITTSFIGQQQQHLPLRFARCTAYFFSLVLGLNPKPAGKIVPTGSHFLPYVFVERAAQRERERQARAAMSHQHIDHSRSRSANIHHSSPRNEEDCDNSLFGAPVRVNPEFQDRLTQQIQSKLGNHSLVKHLLTDSGKGLIGIDGGQANRGGLSKSSAVQPGGALNPNEFKKPGGPRPPSSSSGQAPPSSRSSSSSAHKSGYPPPSSRLGGNFPSQQQQQQQQQQQSSQKPTSHSSDHNKFAPSSRGSHAFNAPNYDNAQNSSSSSSSSNRMREVNPQKSSSKSYSDMSRYQMPVKQENPISHEQIKHEPNKLAALHVNKLPNLTADESKNTILEFLNQCPTAPAPVDTIHLP